MLNNRDSFFSSPPANFDGLFDWDYLNICFPRGIEFTDIDGIVEIGGLLLVVETKDPGKSVPDGQRKMFEVLLGMPNVTLLIIWGKRAAEVSKIQVYDGLGPPRLIYPATAKDAIACVQKWTDHAQWLFETKRIAAGKSRANTSAGNPREAAEE